MPDCSGGAHCVSVHVRVEKCGSTPKNSAVVTRLDSASCALESDRTREKSHVQKQNMALLHRTNRVGREGGRKDAFARVHI